MLEGSLPAAGKTEPARMLAHGAAALSGRFSLERRLNTKRPSGSMLAAEHPAEGNTFHICLDDTAS